MKFPERVHRKTRNVRIDFEHDLYFLYLYLYVFFVVLDLVSSVLCQEIVYEERLWNDLFYVEWDMKP